MTETTTAKTRLATRLRALRTQEGPLNVITQRQVAQALEVSVPLVSSWESLRADAAPTPDRLEALARFYATPRSVQGDTARLLSIDELTPPEEERRRDLLQELLSLREDVEDGADEAVDPRSFWHFPDGHPVRIIASPLPQTDIRSQYASKWHPNYISSLANADMDATIEVYGEIRARNPDSDVQWVAADEVTADVFSSHVVLLGNVVPPVEPVQDRLTDVLQYFVKRLELPISVALDAGGDNEYDMYFEISVDRDGRPVYKGPVTQRYAPKFLTDDETGHRLVIGGQPALEYDVALIAREPNPLSVDRTLTMCCGIFSRGTYGAVRALTDPLLRETNERYLAALPEPDRFWLLTYVPVFLNVDGLKTLTPDLNRPLHVLRRNDS